MAKKPEPESVGVSFRLPAAMLVKIDALAAEQRRTRGNMLRVLLEEALKAAEEK